MCIILRIIWIWLTTSFCRVAMVKIKILRIDHNQFVLRYWHNYSFKRRRRKVFLLFLHLWHSNPLYLPLNLLFANPDQDSNLRIDQNHGRPLWYNNHIVIKKTTARADPDQDPHLKNHCRPLWLPDNHGAYYFWIPRVLTVLTCWLRMSVPLRLSDSSLSPLDSCRPLDWGLLGAGVWQPPQYLTNLTMYNCGTALCRGIVTGEPWLRLGRNLLIPLWAEFGPSRPSGTTRHHNGEIRARLLPYRHSWYPWIALTPFQRGLVTSEHLSTAEKNFDKCTPLRSTAPAFLSSMLCIWDRHGAPQGCDEL